MTQSPYCSGETTGVRGLARGHTEQGHEFRPRCHPLDHLIPTLSFCHHLGLRAGLLSTVPSSPGAHKSRGSSKGPPFHCSGMTVEVLGTVLGTAIQGQIVGQADTPCLQDRNISAVALEGANRTHSTTSLRETVRPLAGRRFGEIRDNGVVCSHPQNSRNS